MKSLLTIAILLCLCGQVLATTYYVKTAANGGSDAAAGTSWATAWATVSKVNSTISAGDIVNFDATGKWYGSQLTPPTGGTSETQTYYKSMTTSDVYTPFGATICAGDSLGGGWSLADHPTDSVYKRVYTPTLTTWGAECDVIAQRGSANGDSLLEKQASLAVVNVPGEIYYDETNDTVYVLMYNLDSKQHPDAYNVFSCTAPVVYGTLTSQQYIHVEGLNLECGSAGNVWFGSDGGQHIKHLTVRDGWIRFGCNRIEGSNGALISSRRASDDIMGGNPATIQHMGMYNSIVACSLDYCIDAEGTNQWGTGMNVYSEWYLTIDSNWLGPHVQTSGFHFKGLYVLPPDASESNPGYQCSNNHIISGDRIGDVAIRNQATTNYHMIYGNVIECNNRARGIWLYLDPNAPDLWGEPVLIYNNTIIDQGTDGIVFGFHDAMTEGDTDIRIKYNVLWNIDNNQYAIKMVENSEDCMTACDSNIYFDSTATFSYSEDGISGNLAWWQSTYSWDGNSVTTNPEFNDAANGDFSRTTYTEWADSIWYGGRWWYTEGAVQPRGGGDPPDPPAGDSLRVRNRDCLGGGLIQ